MMEAVSVPGSRTRVAFSPGFLAGDLASLDSVRLCGSRCQDCRIALLGERRRCENCSSKNVVNEIFSAEGIIYTYTVQRYPPPQPNSLVGPWSPRVLAWVDLAGGPRILGPIDAVVEAVNIGTPVDLVCEVDWIDVEGRDVVAYKFVVADPRRRG